MQSPALTRRVSSPGIDDAASLRTSAALLAARTIRQSGFAPPSPEFQAADSAVGHTPFNTPSSLSGEPRAAPAPLPARLLHTQLLQHGRKPSAAGSGRRIGGTGTDDARGRGIGLSTAGQGVPPTPGNTMNSVEAIRRRMVSTLVKGKENTRQPADGVGIAPSYDRRFAAGLDDIGKHLEAIRGDDSPSPPPCYGRSASLALHATPVKPAEPVRPGGLAWPSSFHDAQTANSNKSILDPASLQTKLGAEAESDVSSSNKQDADRV